MDHGSSCSGKRLLHVDIHIDERETWRGILDLLSRVRPRWKAQDIQMKASECLCRQMYGIRQRLCIFLQTSSVYVSTSYWVIKPPLAVCEELKEMNLNPCEMHKKCFIFDVALLWAGQP